MPRPSRDHDALHSCVVDSCHEAGMSEKLHPNRDGRVYAQFLEERNELRRRGKENTETKFMPEETRSSYVGGGVLHPCSLSLRLRGRAKAPMPNKAYS